MIKVQNVKEAKKEFKRIFKNNSGGLFVKIGCYKGCGNIKISGENKELTLITEVTDFREVTVHLSFINRTDYIFDMIFSEEGFCMECYKNAYRDIKIINENGTECYISQVIFRNKKHTTTYTNLANSCCEVIE